MNLVTLSMVVMEIPNLGLLWNIWYAAYTNLEHQLLTSTWTHIAALEQGTTLLFI